MPPHLRAIATAVPPYRIDQTTAEILARSLFPGMLDRLGPIHANAGISTRWSCVPPDWYQRPHGWRERSTLFVEHGLRLSELAIVTCLARAGIGLGQVDAIVAVSTTGICTPSLDALLIDHLSLRPDVVRLPIFGLGCAGGVLGLARAAALAQSLPGRNILLVVTELCGLTFRPQERTPANAVATALFGDGCAAALVSTSADGPAIAASGEHTWPNSLDVMGWRVEDDGLGVVFSRDIPPLITRLFRQALNDWLGRNGLARDDIRGFCCHPGGAKVVAALEQALDLPADALADERAVLREYGNMSAATVLFVAERRLRRPLPGRTLMTALGPGFTAAFLLLDP
ncbi:MAG TPA: 3-oxoacyl-[acyl-carrier-protein] synthase III C-terminal domain-containing protein [Magnetospirillum sp.]|nr:3-oxoacyl-[acyl-carrier-protein] synthase III C-terminal domain-containing protein [Magnetospirillum sp.]